MKRMLPLLVAIAVGGAGCYQILGLGSFANCNGGNVDATVKCNSGGGGPGGGGPSSSSSSASGTGGGTGPGGGGGGAGGGGGGGGGATCHLSGGGIPTTIISSTEVINANWHSFFMVAATASNQPVIFAAFDRTSNTLYLRGVNDLSSPMTELITYPGSGNGDVDVYQGAVVGGNLVLRIRDTSQFGDLVVPIQGGHLQQQGVTFTPYPNLPAVCSTSPGYPRALAVDEADNSAAYVCSDGGTPETFSLFLDGQLVDSVQGDDSQVNVIANHKFANGKRLLLTFGKQGSYSRLGIGASGLMTPSLLKLSSHAASDIEIVEATTPQAYGANDFVLIGSDVPMDFSSATLYSGRVAATASALDATPPTGSKKRLTTTNLDNVLVTTNADSDGSSIVMAGQNPTGTAVHLDVFDNDGTPIIQNFEVFTTTSTSISGAAAVHTGLGSSYMAGWSDMNSVQAVGMFCSLK